MSIELELEDNGEVRVRVDADGERAVSDTRDPVQLIMDICEIAELTCVVGEEEMHILLPRRSPEEGGSA